jgi:hypothetical protein
MAVVARSDPHCADERAPIAIIWAIRIVPITVNRRRINYRRRRINYRRWRIITVTRTDSDPDNHPRGRE